MYPYYSNFKNLSTQFFVGVLIFSILFSSLPVTIFADETASSTDSTFVEPVVFADDSASSTDNSAVDPVEIVVPAPDAGDTASSSPETGEDDSDAPPPPETTLLDDTATSTATSSDETNENDGTEGLDGAGSSDTGTSTATTTDNGTNGDTGNSGADGTEGLDSGEDTESTASSTAPDLTGEPIPVVTDGLIGDDDSPEDEDITGRKDEEGARNIDITTGIATAQGELFTDANSTNVRSEFDPETLDDLDTYTFNATGTNAANVLNEAASISATGENKAQTDGEAKIITGDAISAFNIANVINSSIINSDGFIYLGNQILEPNTSLDLQDFFFPGGTSILADAADCNLLSCVAEDVVYNFSQTSVASITNDAYIEAVTGDNEVDTKSGTIATGDAYGTANVINMVNTNIIDSNYRLMTFNAIGNLEGDLLLPTEELFDMFFGLPNGVNQQENTDDFHANVDNVNELVVNNNVETYAETGQNDITAVNSTIETGRSESESNILNKVNENLYGGDAMYLWIRIHGYWDGDVVGLPDGLTWEWTPDGVIIYNEDAEITPSQMLGYDHDSYSANFTNHNDVTINNNINVDAITGFNNIDRSGGRSLLGDISTGDAYASANVMNIANTNVIGTNWTMAIVNIMGDFDGNVTFSQTDLSLAGEMIGADNPLEPGSVLNFTYTVANTTDTVATNVVLRQALGNAHVTNSLNTVQSVELGDMNPGDSQVVQLSAAVDSSLVYGTSTVVAIATVSSSEGDINQSNNVVSLSEDLYISDPNADAGTTTTDNTSTTTDDGSDSDDATTTGGSTGGSGGGSSGGGGGGSSSKTKSIDREKKAIDPNSASFLVVTKKADVDEGDHVSAGEEVDYTIVVRNGGGTAYHAVVYDNLINPIGTSISEQSWDLGTILAGEEIKLSYTTLYDPFTPSGVYTNTARIEAYSGSTTKADGGRPLQLDDAVHTVIIDGVPLAVGNVGVLAYFPSANGQVGALVAWETSASSTGQVYYSPLSLYSSTSPYDPTKHNYGYAQKSFRLPQPKTKHLMILNGLKPGVEYTYRVRADSGGNLAQGGDYTFSVPPAVRTLVLAGQSSAPLVAGAATSAPVVKPVPVPVPPMVYVPPVKPKPVVQSEPEPIVSQPEPEPVEVASEPEKTSGVGGFVKKVFGFWR